MALPSSDGAVPPPPALLSDRRVHDRGQCRCFKCFAGRRDRENLAAGIAGGASPSGSDANAAASEYSVHVDGFEVTPRRNTVFYLLTISHTVHPQGHAQWPIRVRFREFTKMHQQITEGLGRSTARRGLPRPPPRVSCRSLCYGSQSEYFLVARSAQLQRYLEALLRYIPGVDQCEVLRNFLCNIDFNRMSYDALLDLGDAVGRGGVQPVIDESMIAALPSSTAGVDEAGTDIACSGRHCTICQEPMTAEHDIRALPCGHEYHYTCIAQWLPVKNVCCICQAPAIVDLDSDSMSEGK